MVELLDGRKAAKELNNKTLERVNYLKEKGIQPCLAVILVGNNQASERYVRMKDKKAQSLGIKSIKITLKNSISEKELLSKIKELNEDDNIDGILVQSPLPVHINEQKILNHISVNKDVDGFNEINAGKLFLNVKSNYPVACTPKGIMTLLKMNDIEIKDKNVTIIGRSNILGRPMAALMLNANANVKIIHSKTSNLNMLQAVANSDIIISAVGKAHLLSDEEMPPEVVVIDAGQNIDENGKLVGDIDYNQYAKNIKSITPVPGGVGPMTIATLMEQTVDLCFERRG